MTKKTVPTQIVDKNGKKTTVHKKIESSKTDKREISNRPFLSYIEQDADLENNPPLKPTGLTYPEVKDGITTIESTGKLTKIENGVLNLAKSLVNKIESDANSEDTTGTLEPSGLDFNEIRSRLTGLHFAKEALSISERSILSYAESLLTKIDNDHPKGYAR